MVIVGDKQRSRGLDSRRGQIMADVGEAEIRSGHGSDRMALGVVMSASMTLPHSPVVVVVVVLVVVGGVVAIADSRPNNAFFVDGLCRAVAVLPRGLPPFLARIVHWGRERLIRVGVQKNAGRRALS